MPPTVQSGSREDRERRGRTGGRSELVCRVKYNNTLPDIPFDPKFITYPFESNRFVQYNPTSLERAYKHELLTEHDLGITIDLINPDTYKIDLNSYLDVEDEKLLEEEVAQPQDSKRSKFHSANVSWLRKTEYISTEYNRFTQSADKAESRVGYSIKKALKEEDVYRDRESQIKAIDSTFEAAKKPIMNHYSKPGVTAVSVLPVFPDFDMWKHPCAQVIFDSDPAPKGHSAPAQIEEMSQAMIRGMVDESGDQFVAYFLPTEETVLKRKRDLEMGIDFEPEEEYDYILSREYNWNVKNKSIKGYEENYFFVFKDTGVYYNELETRVRLNKRRKVGGGGAPTSKSRLIVKHRELNEQEISALDARMMMLEPAMDEEEEEEEMEYVDPDLPKSGDEAGSGDEGEKGDKDAGDDDDDKGSPKSRKSRSRSRSGSRSKSRSRSRSGSRSGSGSRSRSRSASPSRSRSRSKMKSRSRSRSQSGSPDRSRSRSKVKSRSRSRSQSGSPARSRSRSKMKSRSRSRSHSGSPARSRSHSKEKSRSRSRSQSGSPARSPSKAKSRSRSRSRSRSQSGSPARSRSRSQSGSPARSGSGSPAGSPARSPTGSPSRSRSRSRVKSKSKSMSRARSQSGSRSRSPSRSRSRSRSGSRSVSRSRSRSRSGSPGRSGSGSGSDGEMDSKKKDEEEIFGSGSDSD